MRQHLFWILAVVALCVPGGCAWLDYQETKLHSGSRYLAVDAEARNFGYERLLINCRLREHVDEFVRSHGYPEFIYEYNKAAQNGIRLYYLKEDQVYDFLERGANPNSATLLEQRALTSYEKAEIKELQERQPL